MFVNSNPWKHDYHDYQSFENMELYTCIPVFAISPSYIATSCDSEIISIQYDPVAPYTIHAVPLAYWSH